EMNLKRDGHLQRQSPLHLPPHTKIVVEVAVSPLGDRYAISAVVDTHPALPSLLHHIWPSIRVPSSPQVGIYIFSLDGKRHQQIGHTPLEENSRNDLPWDSYMYEMPRDIRWAPDGRHLGFIYKGTLYTVPAE